MSSLSAGTSCTGVASGGDDMDEDDLESAAGMPRVGHAHVGVGTNAVDVGVGPENPNPEVFTNTLQIRSKIMSWILDLPQYADIIVSRDLVASLKSRHFFGKRDPDSIARMGDFARRWLQEKYPQAEPYFSFEVLQGSVAYAATEGLEERALREFFAQKRVNRGVHNLHALTLGKVGSVYGNYGLGKRANFPITE
jgi:hypothetical protein